MAPLCENFRIKNSMKLFKKANEFYGYPCSLPRYFSVMAFWWLNIPTPSLLENLPGNLLARRPVPLLTFKKVNSNPHKELAGYFASIPEGCYLFAISLHHGPAHAEDNPASLLTIKWILTIPYLVKSESQPCRAFFPPRFSLPWIQLFRFRSFFIIFCSFDNFLSF